MYHLCAVTWHNNKNKIIRLYLLFKIGTYEIIIVTVVQIFHTTIKLGNLPLAYTVMIYIFYISLKIYKINLPIN